jgi:hypothetical protein
MVINNLDIERLVAIVRPFKTDAPLHVDPDTELIISISTERLKVVARQLL